MPKFSPLALSGAYEITPEKYGDERGFFSETYNALAFEAQGLTLDFMQDNFSYSAKIGVLRGLHYQSEPFAQDKLVRVLRGSIFDVLVDLREGSPTHKQWVGLEVSAEKWNQVFVPKGFAHGFMTLERDTEIAYKVTAPYNKEHDHAIHAEDEDLGIEWPLPPESRVFSDRDRAAPNLRDVEPGFHIDTSSV